MRPSIAVLAAVGLLAACAGGPDPGIGARSQCFPVSKDDLISPYDEFGGRQIVCGPNLLKPGAREKYRELYPDRLPPAAPGRPQRAS